MTTAPPAVIDPPSPAITFNWCITTHYHNTPSVMIDSPRHYHQLLLVHYYPTKIFQYFQGNQKITLGRNASVSTAQKITFSIKDFFSKCAQETADLVTFTKEILNGKLHFFMQCRFLIS